MSINVTDAVGTLPLVGELAYVGTVPRSWDVGLVRIRGTSGSTLSVSENEIEWNASLYIWCPRTFPPLPRLQRVADVSGTPTIWKDTDLTPVPLPPKVNIACSMFGSVGSPMSGTVTAIPMEASATITNISVEAFPDGVVVLALPSFAVTFPTPGYKVLLSTATDSNGQTGRMVLPVLIDLPTTPGVIIDEIGWTVDSGVTVRLSAPLMETRPLAPAFIKYGNREFLMWVISEEDNIRAGEWRSDLTLLSSVALLDKLVSHAFVLESGARDSWYKVPSLTAARALHLLLEFHSTFNWVTPVYYQSSRANLAIKAQSFSEGSVLSQANDLLKDALSNLVQFSVPAIVCEEPLLVWDRSGINRQVITPTEAREKTPSRIGELRAGGFAGENPYLSRYPGTTPDIWAGKEEVEGLIVQDQTDLNRVAGLLATFKTAPEISVSVAEDLHELPPVTHIWRVGGLAIDGSPQRLSARPEGQTFAVEATIKQELPAREGETIIIPSPPPVTPPDWPVPPEPSPPPYYAGEGLAWLLDAGYVFRSTSYYTFNPMWQQVLALGDVNPGGKPFVAFRYVERAGAVSLVVATEDGEVWYLPNCNADVVSPGDWRQLISKSRLNSLASAYIGEPLDPSQTTVYALMTLVNRPNYVGLMVLFANLATHHTFVTYCFSDDWGANWRFYSDPWWRMTVYARKCWWLENTAGTDELLGMFGTGIFASPSYLYRSLDRGATWYRFGPDQGVAATCKFRKPWQYGVDGRLLYKTGMPWGNEHRLAVSTDGGTTWTEYIPAGFTTVGLGLEYWTYDAGHVMAVVRYGSGNLACFEYRSGTVTRKSDVPNGTRATTPCFDVYGNPANRNEWAVLTVGGDYQANHNHVLLSTTLDGGDTWVDVTGNYRGFLRTPKSFLLTPPFGIRRRQP
jgi:hypothetical protein